MMANDHRRFAVVGKLGHFMAAALLGLFAMSGSAEARTAGESQRAAAAPAGSNRCPGERELNDVKRQARDELDRLEKALGMSKDALAKERADSEKFRKEKMDLERVVSELKQRIGQLEKDSAYKDKLAAAASQRERKARDANEALEKEKSEKDSLILDTAQRVQDLEKESAAKDKQLAASAEREKKERERREKLEHDLDVAAARDRERRTWEASARAERDKLEAVPPVPARIPEPVHCAMPEEVQAGVDLFVRCVTQPTVKAKTLIFYYRPPAIAGLQRGGHGSHQARVVACGDHRKQGQRQVAAILRRGARRPRHGRGQQRHRRIAQRRLDRVVQQREPLTSLGARADHGHELGQLGRGRARAIPEQVSDAGVSPDEANGADGVAGHPM